MTRPVRSLILHAVLLAGAFGGSGCAALTNPVADGVPVSRLPREVFGRSKKDLVPVPLTLLRQKESGEYRLGRGDVLAVIADEVIAPASQVAPVRMPDQRNEIAAVGYPIPVDDSGTISLPRVKPIPVTGKTVREVEDLIRDAVTGKNGNLELVKDPRISVQILQKRHYQVSVVREDTQPLTQTQSVGGPVLGGAKRGAGFSITLQAGENDVLHALNATGGPPGLDAKNEVVVLRGGADPSDPTARKTRIPLRVYPEQPLAIREEDVILLDGDIVKIEARDTEVYYTAGLIGGGQYQLPRDYDLDVIQAIAQVRGPLINGGFSQNAFIASATGSGVGNPSPSLVTVLRQLPDNRQVPIRVDLNKAFRDPRERITIQPGDVIVMQERPGEAVTRYLTQTFRFATGLQVLSGGSLTQSITGSNP